MNNNIFLEYLSEEKNNSPECIKNHKNKRVVFKKEINGQNYYIKKFCLPGRRGKLLALGLREDKVNRNIRISQELEKLNIPHVKIVFSYKEKISFLKSVSLLVTEEGGEVLGNFVWEFEKYRELFVKFFDLFIKLCKNNIYPDDYSYINVLVNGKKELVLFDFDEYKIPRFFKTKKFKKRILQNLKDCLLEEEMEKLEELVKFSYDQVKRVQKELGWKDIEID